MEYVDEGDRLLNLEYPSDIAKNEYLVVIDRSGDVIVRRMFLSFDEALQVENRIDIYSVIRMNKLKSLNVLKIEDLGDEEEI